jgi:hypothetical protein
MKLNRFPFLVTAVVLFGALECAGCKSKSDTAPAEEADKAAESPAAAASAAAEAPAEAPAPPAEKAETPQGTAPSTNHVWSKGYWRWQGGRYVWINGSWRHRPNGRHWVDGRWDNRRGRHVWIPGHWR